MDFIQVAGGTTALNLSRIDSARLLPDGGLALSIGPNAFHLEPGDETDAVIKHFGLKTKAERDAEHEKREKKAEKDAEHNDANKPALKK
jgi:hypothetical protein